MELKARFTAPVAAVVAMTLVATALSACGSTTAPKAPSAADFIRQVTTQFSRGQTGPLWDTLHPADQAIVSRSRYMACHTSAGFELQKFTVIQTYPDPIDIAGKVAPSTAVTVRVTADNGVTTATIHAVSVKGAWRWILSPADYAAYKQGKCPSS
jgi:hypothetical protein